MLHTYKAVLNGWDKLENYGLTQKDVAECVPYCLDFTNALDMMYKPATADFTLKPFFLPTRRMFIESVGPMAAKGGIQLGGIILDERGPNNIFVSAIVLWPFHKEGQEIIMHMKPTQINSAPFTYQNLLQGLSAKYNQLFENPTNQAVMRKNPKSWSDQDFKVALNLLDMQAKFLALILLANIQNKMEIGENKVQVKYRDTVSKTKVSFKRSFKVWNLGQTREIVERNVPIRLKWSCRFEVQGHWRRIDPQIFGKDREGIYNQLGFTWVVEHIRGDKDAPLKVFEIRPTLIKLPTGA